MNEPIFGSSARLARALRALVPVLAAATYLAPWVPLMGCSAEQPEPTPPTPIEAETPKVEPVAPEPDGDTTKVREELRTAVVLPDYYPKDAPVYPGSTTNNAGLRSGRVTAVFSSQDPREQVQAYFDAKLPLLGWTEIELQTMPNGSVTLAQKEAREISVLVSYMDEGTEYAQTIVIVAVDP